MEKMEKTEKTEKMEKMEKGEMCDKTEVQQAPQGALPFEDGLVRRFLDAAGSACQQHHLVR